MSAAQQQAIQTAQRLQRISNEYSKATGNTGKLKTKEGKNIFKNWGKALQNAYKKFCQTADKVNIQKSGVVALSPGTTWKLPELKLPSLPKGAKVAGKAVWIITVVDLTNKAVNYIEHGDTDDLVVGGDITPEDTWANKDSLKNHYDRHGDDFSSKSEEDYAEKGNELYRNKDKHQTKVDTDGTIRVYDPETNTFGSYTSDGKTKTIFKPSAGQGYFDRQPGIIGGK